MAPGESRAILWGYWDGLHEILGDSSVRVDASYESRGGMHPSNPTHHASESVLEVASFESNRLGRHLPSRRVAALEQAGDVHAIADKITDRNNPFPKG